MGKTTDKAKEIEHCYQQREQQILEYQKYKPFSYLGWVTAFCCGWLKQHCLKYDDFPSPTSYYKKLLRYSKEPFFVEWREEIRENHQEYKRERQS